jgi:hypothetical protein
MRLKNKEKGTHTCAQTTVWAIVLGIILVPIVYNLPKKMTKETS